MSDKQEIDNNSPTSPTHSMRDTKRPPMPLTPEQRKKKQERFLKSYRECGNIKHSCKVAGISRSTFYDWRDLDPDFQAQLPDAKEDACDVLELAAYERAVHGVNEPVVSQGQLVYEYEPVLDEKGNQEYDDKGKPKFKRGKQVMKRVYSDTLLSLLLKANLPTKYRENKSVELTGKDGGAIQTYSTIDLSGLSTTEIQTLLAIAEKTEKASDAS